MTRHLLILDLDETLIHATAEPRDNPGRAAFRIGQYEVYRRPHLDEFLGFVHSHFELAVWSSASHSYVTEMTRHLFPSSYSLRFVWSSDRCTLRLHPEYQDYYWVKDLRKVKRAGFALERVLMIDDTPEKLERNYGNHLRVRAFEGQGDDSELRDILPFLEWICSVDNVRAVEKRHWRQFKRGLGD